MNKKTYAFHASDVRYLRSSRIFSLRTFSSGVRFLRVICRPPFVCLYSTPSCRFTQDLGQPPKRTLQRPELLCRQFRRQHCKSISDHSRSSRRLFYSCPQRTSACSVPDVPYNAGTTFPTIITKAITVATFLSRPALLEERHPFHSRRDGHALSAHRCTDLTQTAACAFHRPKVQ